MCVSDTSGRPREGIFTRAHGETSANGPGAVSGPVAAGAWSGPDQRSIATLVLSGLIHGYRLLISPWLGPRCRFLPTCSDYALDALARHGAIRGGWLTIRRLARCQPLGGSGFDPVPSVQGISAPNRFWQWTTGRTAPPTGTDVLEVQTKV